MKIINKCFCVYENYQAISWPAQWASQHGAVVLQKPLIGNGFIQTIDAILST